MEHKAITLTLAQSVTLAGPRTSDARDIDSAMRAVRIRVEAMFTASPRLETVEIYGCKRHGGCMVRVYDRSSFGGWCGA